MGERVKLNGGDIDSVLLQAFQDDEITEAPSVNSIKDEVDEEGELKTLTREELEAYLNKIFQESDEPATIQLAMFQALRGAIEESIQEGNPEKKYIVIGF